MQFTDLLDAYLDARAASDAFLRDPRKSRNELYTARELWTGSREYHEYQAAKEALNKAFEAIKPPEDPKEQMTHFRKSSGLVGDPQ